MSTSLHIGSYPHWLLELSNEFEKGARYKRLVFQTPGQARAARLMVYGFRRAIRHEGMSESYPSFLSARVSVKGKVLELTHADDVLTPTLKKDA